MGLVRSVAVWAPCLGAAPNNLEARLPSDGAALAHNVAKDPLVLVTTEAEEMDIEEALTQRMSQTLAEFGRGLRSTDASTISMWRAKIAISTSYLYTHQQTASSLWSSSQESSGRSTWDRLTERAGMAPAVGILVCGSKHDPTVRYALDGSSQPIAVASYTYDALPPKDGKRFRLP